MDFGTPLIYMKKEKGGFQERKNFFTKQGAFYFYIIYYYIKP